MELDLPTGTGSSNGDHLAKFLSTLTQLVDILGKTGPAGGGTSTSTSGAADATGGKNLVKATQKLFTDLAAAFKPLKNVLATFGTIHPPAAATPAAPTTSEAPSGNRLDDQKYDRFFNGPPTPPRPEAAPVAQAAPTPFTPAPTAPPTPATPQAQPQEDTPLPKGALTIEDASIGIDYASVKMPAPPAPKKKPEPKEQEPLLAKVVDIDTNLVKITVPTASFKIASALIQGKFLMPPEAAPAAAAPTEAKQEPAPKEKTDEAPAAKPAPSPKAEKAPKPKSVQEDSGKKMLTWTNVFARLIGAADERKQKPQTKNKNESESAEEKNTAAKEAAQNLQNAIINIANGVVNVTTAGEKKPEEQQAQQEKPQQQPQQEKPKPITSGAPKIRTGIGPMPKAATKGPKQSPTPTGTGGPKGPKMGDPRKAILLKLASLATGINQATIAVAHKIVDGAQKAGKLVGSGVAAPFQEVGKKVMAGAGMLTKAFSDPLGAFQDLTRMMIGFVEVVNPATVMQFNKALKDVSAIFGKVLAPALAIAAQIVREFGDIIAPLYEQMTPFVTMLARAFGDMFISMIRISAIIGQVLLPITKSLYIVLAGLARIVTAVLEGFTVLLAGFLGTFTGLDDLVQTAVDAIVDFSKWIVRAAVSVAVLVAKMFGASQFIQNMQKVAGNKGATNRTDSTGQAAPTMSQFQNLEGFGKNIAQASFTATAVPNAPKKTDDFLATISDDIQEIAQIDLKQIIVDAILQAGKDAVKNTAQGAAKVAYDYNPLKVPGEAIGNFIGGLLFG